MSSPLLVKNISEKKSGEEGVFLWCEERIIKDEGAMLELENLYKDYRGWLYGEPLVRVANRPNFVIYIRRALKQRIVIINSKQFLPGVRLAEFFDASGNLI